MRGRITLGLGVAAFLAGILAPTPGQAQNCWQGSPDCESFWITEAGYTPRLSAPPRPLKESFYLHWELGYMRNLDNRQWALGGAGFLGLDDDGSRFALKVRLRRWLGQDVSVDLAPGILFAGSDSHFESNVPGFTGHLAINHREWLQVVAMLEVIDLEPKQAFPDLEPNTDVSWYGGVKLGGVAGVIGTVILGFAGFAAAEFIEI